jgi:type II secretory pathway component PulJ
MKMNQAEMEALYSQRNINTVLKSTIQYELDKKLLNWALITHLKLHFWLEEKPSYDSKAKRLHVLKKQIERDGLDSIVIAIAATILHTNKDQTLQQAVGYLQAHLDHADTFHRATTAGELLAVCASPTGLFNIEKTPSGESTMVTVPYREKMEEHLLDTFVWINDTCFNPPLIEPPKEITHNGMCGYHTLNEPFILGTLTMHDEYQNYKPNNILNQIEWVLDQDVLAEPELPSKPHETAEAQIQFSEMVKASRVVYDMLGTDPFYLCWQDDSRGRLYSHGYHVNFQAAEYKKAALSFNKYEVLT